MRVRSLVEQGALELLKSFAVEELDRTSDGALFVSGVDDSGGRSIEVDELVVATGLRPDLGILNEVRLDLDPALECPRALAPLIDPNLHNCGTVRPHGAAELEQPEPGLFIAGMKSYGRAPTFLLVTGYEQVRSIAAFLAGDIEASRRVELDLPQTGVCSSALALRIPRLLRRPRAGRDQRLLRRRYGGEGGRQGNLRVLRLAKPGPARSRVGRMSEIAAPGDVAPKGAASSRPKVLVISAIGVAQILAWGSSYYLPAVLARPIAANTGWPLDWVMGALSLGLLVSGLVSPRVGRVIERRGGRPVLATSAVLLAVGLLGAGLAPRLPAFLASWVVIGFGMGMGLYDPAFSTLGRLYGEDARSAITQLTLFGGFASTVCWPLTAFLNAHLGWRGTCLTYAGILAAGVAPLYLLALPREEVRIIQRASASAPPLGRVAPEQRAAFILLAAGFTLAYGTMTVIGVYLLILLQSRGLALAAAVGLGVLVGPAQVGGRESSR